MKLIVLKHRDEDKVYALHRKFLELAIFITIKQELQSGDLHVVNGSEYDNYRNRYVSPERVRAELPNYAAQVQLPLTDADEYITYLKDLLIDKCREVNKRFPANSHATIEDGKISLKQLRKKVAHGQVKHINGVLDEKLEQVSILDALIDVEHRLNLKKHFYPLSGHEGKLEDPEFRFITNLFCYGCNLGPTQTANSIKGLLSARQLAWLNIKYVTEDRLDLALKDVINAYKKFDLPNYWGTGKSASVDGTKWELYEQNMISSYHIRYGGYGGIGYYHVSDTYIALFSHFIPCGVYEAVYILDGLLKNESDIQPDTIHGDTQAQSFPVFGLSHLLGIKLMPRIRNIQDLNLYKPEKQTKYDNIEDLFSGSIDFNLIEKHLPDMLQVAISIKLGVLTPSTLLKRLGTYSRKNKVYFAFRELGKVIRTLFLLDYIDKPELRHTINAETNKSEEFNDFIKWFFFGDKGIISENLRHEQLKIVKYNHLIANMMILYNTDKLTRILRELRESGEEITPEILGHFSPYRRAHFNRLGDYTVDMERVTSPFEFKLAP